jgi:hypothetical protein
LHLTSGSFLLVLILAACLLAGPAAAHSEDCDTKTARPRPISLGVSGANLDSIGRRFCCTGTLGSLVQDSSSNQYILSNSHVLATADNSQAVIQPGLADSNCVQNFGDEVADGVAFIPISHGFNVVDAAIAQIVSGDVDSSGAILNIPKIAAGGAVTPTLKLKVQKMGRTTCLTTGKVTGVEATIRVRYPKVCNLTFTGTAIFAHQIQIRGRRFSAAGDSGSLVVTTGSCPGAVGLLFAGGRSVTFANPMSAVLGGFSVPLTMVGHSCTPTATVLAADAPAATSSASPPMSKEVKTTAAVKQRHEAELMAIPGVVGTGVGLTSHGRMVIKVYVEKDTPRVRASVPSSLEAIPVEVEETGPIVAY